MNTFSTTHFHDDLRGVMGSHNITVTTVMPAGNELLIATQRTTDGSVTKTFIAPASVLVHGGVNQVAETILEWYASQPERDM